MRNLHIGVFMIKPILFFWLCLLFSNHVLAEMSDQEKREFIEFLAKPLKEKKVFYRWQSETARKNLIEAGQLTPNLHRYFMEMDWEKGIRNGRPATVYAGPGVYISEKANLSEIYGETLIQVEVEPGYKFLDVSDEGIVEALKVKGISLEDVYLLNPNVAVKDVTEREAWVLKAREGVKFKPFSSKNINLKELEALYQKGLLDKPFFVNLIRDDILSRAEQEVMGSRFINFLEEEHGKQYLRDAAHRHKDSLGLNEINGWLKHAGQYLNKEIKNSLIDRVLQLPIDSMEQSAALLENMKRQRALNQSIEEKIIRKTPINSLAEGALFLKQAGKFISRKNQKIIADKAKIFPVHNVKEVTDLIKSAPFLTVRDKENIVSKLSINSVDDFLSLMRVSENSLQYIPPGSIKKMARQIIPLISNVREGMEILENAGKYLELSDRKRIAREIIPLISNATEGREILERAGKYLEPEDKKRIVKKTIPLISTAVQGRRILERAGGHLDSLDRRRIVNKIIPLISTVEEGREILFKMERDSDLSDKKRIINKIIPLISTAEEGEDILKRAGGHLDPLDKKRILKKTIPLISTAEEGREILERAGGHLDPLDKKRIAKKAIPLISTAEEGREILERAGEYLDPSDKKRIVNKIIPLISTAAEGENILKSAERHLDPSDKRRIINKIIPLISTAVQGRRILERAGKYLEPEDKKRIAKRILKFTGKNGIEDLKKLLTDEEHKELVAELENRGRRKPKVSSHTDSGKKAKRLNCLKKQLSQIAVQ